MSVEDEVFDALEADAGLITILGGSSKIIRGTLEQKFPYLPPLVLVDVRRGKPALETEDRVLADSWECVVGVIKEGSPAGLVDALTSVLELLGFECTGSRSLKGERPEWSAIELRFTGSRMRQ